MSIFLDSCKFIPGRKVEH